MLRVMHMDNTEVIAAFLRGFRKWTGCCWPTEFGPLKLNLEGVKSSQAALMAGATTGSERAEWCNATDWLKQVEDDARKAEEEAQHATNLAVLGHLREARQHAQEACHLESQYTSFTTWRPLLTAIVNQLESAGIDEQPDHPSTPAERSDGAAKAVARDGSPYQRGIGPIVSSGS